MWKSIALGLLMMGAWTAARAETWEGPPDPAQMERMHLEHLERLRQLLSLKPEQEAAWKDFVEKTRPPAPPPREEVPRRAPDKLAKLLEHMRAQQTQVQEHLSVLREFYGQLSSEQQDVFDRESPPPPPPQLHPPRPPRGEGPRE